MIKLSAKKSPKNRQKIAKASSLPAYIAIIFLIALFISLTAFKIFWDSPTRELVVEIQKATEEEIENPLLTTIETDGVNLENGILEAEELNGLRYQMKELLLNLNPEDDFHLDTSSDF